MSPLPRQRDLEPVGDILVSYSADQLPTETIDILATETRRDVEQGEIDIQRGYTVMSWLCRIALQKLRAVEP